MSSWQQQVRNLVYRALSYVWFRNSRNRRDISARAAHYSRFISINPRALHGITGELVHHNAEDPDLCTLRLNRLLNSSQSSFESSLLTGMIITPNSIRPRAFYSSRGSRIKIEGRPDLKVHVPIPRPQNLLFCRGQGDRSPSERFPQRLPQLKEGALHLGLTGNCTAKPSQATHMTEEFAWVS
jgi:hypothetical protein